MDDKKNSAIYDCERDHADVDHFVSPQLGPDGNATYGKPVGKTWKAGGGCYGDDD